jgi:hypothetical protein
MVFRLRPLDVTLTFEDRSYKLGETISCTVELVAKADIDVREARIDLVCQVHWAESYTVMVPAAMPSRSGAMVGPTGGAFIPPKVPKQVSKDHKESYIHSSVVFLQDAQLQSDSRNMYQARLEIQPETPANAERGTVSWSVVAAIDIARARDVNKKEKVRVTLT